ncbi:predicted protein [Thalassiosira pseudonana CCMP1335]|uniref:Methyltransferase domain-containing protein n=1 Tax=Thalassiosira pseudonana TaxID=35128 RepID=B8CDI8_THAPS|nr:predicted protein [Thalassiosira pseudonana CCMP1335]EED88462.1 predicted protein [Thalassiosira pseudonana CCMP1335]
MTDDSEEYTKSTQLGRSSSTSNPWENPRSMVGSLLEKTTSRVLRTLSTTSATTFNEGEVGSSAPNEGAKNASVDNVIDSAIVRSSSVLESPVERNDINSQCNDDSSPPPKPKKQHQDKRTYLGNPSVTPTALAHSLWQSTILPYHDTVIDATCGNGKDCLALARMLFPKSVAGDDDVDENNPQPQLIGIDIQSRAIRNTQKSLLASLPTDIYYNHVSVLEQSHEHLMDVPRHNKSVGLVCYNLGYLPGAGTPSGETSFDYKEYASLLLRIGGMLSIMTYPGSNLEESIAVEHFVEGLAMLTTRNEGGWRGYVDNIPEYVNEDGTKDDSIRVLITQAIERVVAEGPKKQTWRAFVHKPLGRPLSPVLATAMRINLPLLLLLNNNCPGVRPALLQELCKKFLKFYTLQTKSVLKFQQPFLVGDELDPDLLVPGDMSLLMNLLSQSILDEVVAFNFRVTRHSSRTTILCSLIWLDVD